MAQAKFAIGRQLEFFCKKETALGGNFGTATQEVFATANCAKVTASTMDFTVERSQRLDSSPTRSVTELITGKEEISWTAESYILANGSTAPDIDPLLEAAFGGAFASSKYTLTDGTDELPSLHVCRGAAGVFREDIYGAWVEEFGLSVSGGDVPKMTFSGGAMHYSITGTSTTINDQGSDSTALTVSNDDGDHFTIGSRIAIADTSGAHTVTSVDVNADTNGNDVADNITLGTAAQWNTNKAITPYFPTTAGSDFSGSPVVGIAGSLTLGKDLSTGDALSYSISSFDVTLTNGIKPLSDSAFTTGASDYIPLVRSVTGSIAMRGKKENFKALLRRGRLVNGVRSFPATDITVVVGDTATKKIKITMPQCELNFAGIDIPETEEAVLNIPFTALATSAGKDEIEFHWNQS